MLSAKRVIAVKARYILFIFISDCFLSLFVFKNAQNYTFILEKRAFSMLKSVKFGFSS